MIVILDCKDTTHEPKSYHATRCNISPLNSNITLYKSPVLQSITAHVAKHSFLQRYICNTVCYIKPIFDVRYFATSHIRKTCMRESTIGGVLRF